MSRGQDYFPPNGTGFKWGSKALDYSPWKCDPLAQHAIVKGINEALAVRCKRPPWHCPSICVSPLHIVLRVDQADGHFKWYMDKRDWSYQWEKVQGEAKTALEACLAAEAMAEACIKELFPEWVIEALMNNWRPPCGLGEVSQ